MLEVGSSVQCEIGEEDERQRGEDISSHQHAAEVAFPGPLNCDANDAVQQRKRCHGGLALHLWRPGQICFPRRGRIAILVSLTTSGATFVARWADEKHSVDDLYYMVRTLMPYGKPAPLSKQEYIDIIAYLWMMNGYAAGAQALPWIRACSAHNNMA